MKRQVSYLENIPEMPLEGRSRDGHPHGHGSPQVKSPARMNLFEVIKKRGRGGKKEDEMRCNVTSQYSHFVPLRRLVLEK